MANKVSSKSTTTKKTSAKKEVKVVDNIEEKKEESAEVKALKEQIAELQKAISLMAEQRTMSPAPIIYNQEDEDVIIGCRIIQGVGWGDPSKEGGEIRLRYGEEQSVTVSDMKRFFRQSSIRRLFIDGICYFTEPKDYKIFNIKDYLDLSSENLSKILTKRDINDVIRDLDKLTESKKNSRVINCLIFRIADMIRHDEIEWDYYTRKAIEEYFGTEFDRNIATLKAMDNLIVK